MASSSATTTTSSGGSGTGSGSYPIQNSGSEEDLQQLMDQRTRKRKISNRESAKRSRMRKQQHLDGLATQLSQLTKENHRIMSNVSILTQNYMIVESENSILRAQVSELSHRLQSLNEIIAFMNQPVDTGCGFPVEEFVDEFVNNSLSQVYANQLILASADMIQY